MKLKIIQEKNMFHAKSFPETADLYTKWW